MKLRGLLTASLICLANVAPADVTLDYESLEGSKAMALVPGLPESSSYAHGQANDLTAALTALQSCDAARTHDQPNCELRQLNGEVITSGAEIRADVPQSEHPLHLWRIEGSQSTIYLAGSVHILKPSLYPLPSAFSEAFDAADALVVEVNVGAVDPMELRRKTLAFAALPQGQRISTVVPEDLLNRLESSLDRYGIPLAQVGSVKPAFLMNQLVLLRLTSLGYQGEYGVEQHFLKQLGNRQILELETIDEQLALLFDQPMSLQLQLLEDTLDQEPEIEPLIAGMIGAWLSGDDALFMEMFEAQSGDSEQARRFTEQLLDERNVGMADKIRSYLSGEGTYFVLVGAAHLLGDRGIIALLSREGIRAERLTSKSTIH